MRGLGAMVTAVLVLVAGCGTGPRAHAGPAVVTRVLQLARGKGRPLPTTLWYRSGPDGAGMAAGRHPIVLFSHGLGGLPEQFEPLATGWAEAGYVVAAPTYPHTNGNVKVDAGDIRRQSADAAYVLTELTSGDLAPHLDSGRVAAVGFSAGGTTTLGMLRQGHSPGLRAAVSVAGRRPAAAFAGPGVPVLFLHGDRDPVVPIEAGRAAYDAVPWRKQFVEIPGAGHGQYLNPGNPDYLAVSARILEFLGKNV
ncbi:alpha/beta hydrolase family protein [Actinoplanes aureus]|uniref:Dienelactone hydrolase family protein n=1 Tax=Actinoplanes aureus TaxID=2792083 RepID=A0A931FYJ4_9ACTN|nr:dienelactone hydrolase family protein [Actinoplanes aureus]MBG0563817.1 dienelactone hydrolase family protein [Actinoplanes aureus]